MTTSDHYVICTRKLLNLTETSLCATIVETSINAQINGRFQVGQAIGIWFLSMQSNNQKVFIPYKRPADAYASPHIRAVLPESYYETK